MNSSFDDVLILPNFSTVESRKDVVTISVITKGDSLTFPIISSNMDSVTGPKMSKAMLKYGAQACLHRFQSIEDNVNMFLSSIHEDKTPWVSIGLGQLELNRARALYDVGAKTFVIDVAHGASSTVVKQTKDLREIVKDRNIIVGNFATKESIRQFIHSLGNTNVEAIKVGIGGGSVCTTRVVTGCGVPTFSSIIDCNNCGVPIIADGGIRNSGDIAKAIAAGASGVMIGRLLAGCTESPSEMVVLDGGVQGNSENLPVYKSYRGSASASSYIDQGKEAKHRTAEGESTLIPYTGPVEEVLQQLEAGLRSSMSYVGAHTIKEFQHKARFIQISGNGLAEGEARL